jgi:hypothetical protein
VSDLPSSTGERPRLGCLAAVSLLTVWAIGFADFLAAAAGSVDFVLEATAIALVALIILGSARLAPARQMILVGAGYLAFSVGVTGWEVLDGVAMIVTGAVAVTFGVVSIGPGMIVARTRQLAMRVTGGRRP